MLVIRSSQMSVLNRVQFERWLRGQLTQNFSGRARALGPEGVRAWVSLGVDRAVALGFTEEREMGLYVTLMFLLGRDFEGDPRFAEVSRALSAPEAPTARMDSAFQWAIRWVEAEEKRS